MFVEQAFDCLAAADHEAARRFIRLHVSKKKSGFDVRFNCLPVQSAVHFGVHNGGGRSVGFGCWWGSGDGERRQRQGKWGRQLHRSLTGRGSCRSRDQRCRGRSSGQRRRLMLIPILQTREQLLPELCGGMQFAASVFIFGVGVHQFCAQDRVRIAASIHRSVVHQPINEEHMRADRTRPDKREETDSITGIGTRAVTLRASSSTLCKLESSELLRRHQPTNHT
jgi:hypothetical protein